MQRKLARTDPLDEDADSGLLQIVSGTARDAAKMISDDRLRALRDRLESEAYDSLKVEVDEEGGWLGFGRRIIVPANQLHVVSGYGWRNDPFFLKQDTKVFGPRSDSGKSVYWMNSLSEVIALSTTTFIVPVAGPDGIGVDVLDKNGNPYNLTAHVTAKLDPNKALDAATSVGTNYKLLVTNIQEVTEGELIFAASQFTLEEVLNKRTELAELAKKEVVASLTSLGYVLDNFVVAYVRGQAVFRKQEEALAEVTRSSTVNINTAELATNDSTEARRKQEAEVKAKTDEEIKTKTLTSEQAQELAQANKDEAVGQRQNTLDLANEGRAQSKAEAEHQTALKRIALDEKEAIRNAEKDAEVNRLTQEKAKALLLAASTADAERLATEQTKSVERENEKAKADAERQKEVEQIRANSTAEALKITSDAEAAADERKAAADKLRAEGQRALAAAPGLAEADVRARDVEIAQKQVDVDKSAGLAQVEVAEKQAALFVSNPALLELEKLKLDQAHTLRIEELRLAAQVQVAQAFAPNMNIHLIGDGGKVSQIMATMMQIASGTNYMGDQIPAVGHFLGNNSTDAAASTTGLNPNFMNEFLPFIRRTVAEMNPRFYGKLTLVQLADALTPVIQGRDDLASALAALRKSSGFQLIADAPIAAVLKKMGLSPATNAEETETAS